MKTYQLSAEQINKAICDKYDLNYFDCLIALFGTYQVKDQSYLISVSAEKLEQIKDIRAELFESYVEDCYKIYEYLLSAGYVGDVYIRS